MREGKKHFDNHKLYIKGEYSQESSNWLKENNETIPLTSFHELELINAIHLKQFRTEITLDETCLILSRFTEHEKVEYIIDLN